MLVALAYVVTAPIRSEVIYILHRYLTHEALPDLHLVLTSPDLAPKRPLGWSQQGAKSTPKESPLSSGLKYYLLSEIFSASPT